ncbi:hypothetical protein RCM00_22090 [Escherichia marmotae]|nr:hypothetical protein [Escherichia marmotae]
MGGTPEISGLDITDQQLAVQQHHCNTEQRQNLLPGILSATGRGQ